MCDYTKGQIYMIEPKCEYEEGDVYYGSTIQPLSKRLGHHRGIYKKNICDCRSSLLFEKYGDLKIVLIKLFPCNSKKELEAEEAKYIRENKCINKFIPLRTKKEYYEDNKDKIAEKKKEKYKKNKEQILEKNKEYRENNKEKIKEYLENNKDKIAEKKKEKYKKNKEQIKEKSKEYYENNKDKIKEKSKENYEKKKNKKV